MSLKARKMRGNNRKGDSIFREDEHKESRGENHRDRVDDLFEDIDVELDRVSERLNDLFSRVQSMIRNLTMFGFDRSNTSSPAMLPERILPRENRFDLVSFNSEVFRRFMLTREEPLVETAIDEMRGELRIIVIMPGIRKEDIELELTENMVTARSISSGDNNRSITVPLPVPVKIRSIETTYANGVLEMRLKVRSRKKYYKVKIK
ncbi:MAG: hypothetical protein PXY39_08595 [archaeon]|nr:hypothetical protein [archaeon]